MREMIEATKEDNEGIKEEVIDSKQDKHVESEQLKGVAEDTKRRQKRYL